MSSLNTSRVKRLTEEGLWVLSGQVVSILGALALVKVLTQYLVPEIYGQLVLGLTVAGLANQVLMGGVTAGIGRYYTIAVEKDDLAGYLRASQRLMRIAAVTAIIIALAFATGLCFLGISKWLGLAGGVLVLSIISGYNAAVCAILNCARQRAIVAIHSSVDAWLKIWLAVLGMLWVGISSTAVVLGYIASMLLVTASQLVFLRWMVWHKRGDGHTFKKWERQIWAYSWPFSVFGIFTWMQQVSDKWALQAFSSEEEVGLYAVLFQLGYVPIGLLISTVVSFVGPILYQRSGSLEDHRRNISAHDLAWRITIVGVLITALGFFFTLVMHDLIFELAVGKEYHTVSGLLPWVVMAGGFFAAGQMLSIKLMSEMKTTEMISPKIVTAILGVSMNIYGASLFGMTGVVVALVCFSSVYFIWMAWLAHSPPKLP